MKTSLVKGMILLSALFAFARAAEATQCRMSDVAGKYGYTSSGTVVNPALGPFATVGHVTLTDTGTFSGTQTTSIGGNLFDETVDGTFTVNPDCTGTAAVNVYHGGTLARTSGLNMVWDNHEKEFRAIFLTVGAVITISGRKMFAEEED
jgi:hypothetical protein